MVHRMEKTLALFPYLRDYWSKWLSCIVGCQRDETDEGTPLWTEGFPPSNMLQGERVKNQHGDKINILIQALI